MKRSILIAASILLLVVAWIGSGQFTNVKAQDESSKTIEQNQSEEKIILDNYNNPEIKSIYLEIAEL